jgi:hypothetical protein
LEVSCRRGLSDKVEMKRFEDGGPGGASNMTAVSFTMEVVVKSFPKTSGNGK